MKLTPKTVQNISVTLICFLVFALPLVFSPTTTDIFYLNKHTFLIIITGLLFVLFNTKTVLEKSLRLTTNPFNLPLILLFLSYLLSTLVKSRNLSLTLSYPLSTTNIFAFIILFFLIVNIIKTQKELNFVISSLIISVTILSVHSIYQLIGLGKLIPVSWAQAQTFTPAGSPINLLSLLILTLPFPLYLAFKNIAKKSLIVPFLLLSSIIIILALALNINTVFIKKQNQPILLDNQTSWQIAFESLKVSPLVGIGPGNYLSAFTQFKSASFARTPRWNILFSSASNFYLQILTENGVFGLIAIALLIFVFVRTALATLQKLPQALPSIITLGLLFAILLFIPSNFMTRFLLFLLLSIFALQLKLKNLKAHDIILSLFTLSILPADTAPTPKKIDEIFTKGIFALTLVFVLLVFYFQTKVYAAHYYFKKSFDAVAKNQGTQAYNLQMKTIQTFPQSDIFRVAYSQTNIALANALARQENLSDEDKNNIRQLILQAIREAKAATALNAQNVQNWENLARTYSQLINFANGADQWAIDSYNQAIRLDRFNPRLILDAGGLFYNLQKFDEAAGLFQVAINLKPNYANAYYNLAAALREKKDYQNAIAALKKALELVPKDSNDYAKAQADLTQLESLAQKAPLKEEEEVKTGETLAKPSPIPEGDKMPVVTLEKEDAPPIPPEATESAAQSPQPSPTPAPSPGQ